MILKNAKQHSHRSHTKKEKRNHYQQTCKEFKEKGLLNDETTETVEKNNK